MFPHILQPSTLFERQHERGAGDETVAWKYLGGLAALLCLGPLQAAPSVDDGAAARALLEKALGYYHDQGDKAFAAFSRQGEFVDHDRYVFVVDTQGVMLASGGPSSALIGRDVSQVLGRTCARRSSKR